MLILLIFVVSFPLLFTAATDAPPPPQSCTTLRATKEDYSFDVDGYRLYSMDLKILNLGGTTWIYVSNFSCNHTGQDYPNYICADVPFAINDPDPQKCSAGLDSTFAFSIQDPSFYLHAHLGGSWEEIYSGYADDGTFSYGDGSLFTTQNSSYSYYHFNMKGSYNFTQQCIEFAPAPVETAKSPKCKAFESQTVILNPDNTTYANYTASYFINGKYITSMANFTGPPEYFVLYYTNGDDCYSTYKQCTGELINGDQKIIISSSIVKRNGTDIFGDAIPMIGRIILRGDQTLMKEGVPYTASNACLYSNYTFGKDKKSINKFCCTEFEL